MTRFYFHIRDSLHLIPDEEGLDLSNMAAPRLEAEASAGDLARATCSSASAVEITDDSGRCLDRVEVRVRRLA